jgi:hypothetical protein
MKLSEIKVSWPNEDPGLEDTGDLPILFDILQRKLAADDVIMVTWEGFEANKKWSSQLRTIKLVGPNELIIDTAAHDLSLTPREFGELKLEKREEGRWSKPHWILALGVLP